MHQANLDISPQLKLGDSPVLYEPMATHFGPARNRTNPKHAIARHFIFPKKFYRKRHNCPISAVRWMPTPFHLLFPIPPYI